MSAIMRTPMVVWLFAGLLTGTAIVAVIAAHAGTLGYMVGVR